MKYVKKLDVYFKTKKLTNFFYELFDKSLSNFMFNFILRFTYSTIIFDIINIMLKEVNISEATCIVENFLNNENVKKFSILSHKLFVEQSLYLYSKNISKFLIKIQTKKTKNFLEITLVIPGDKKNIISGEDIIIQNLINNAHIVTSWKYRNNNNVLTIKLKKNKDINIKTIYSKYLKTEKKEITKIAIIWLLNILIELVSPIFNATLLKYIVDIEFNKIIWFACCFSISCIIGHILNIKLNKLLNNLCKVILNQIQPELASNILNCKNENFNNNESGFFIQILSNESKSILNSFQMLYLNINSITSLIGIIIAYLILSPYVFIFEILAIIFFLFIENYRTNRLNDADKKYRNINDDYTSFSNELIKGQSDIKLLFRKNWVINKFKNISIANNEQFINMYNNTLNLKLLRRELSEIWNLIFTICIAFAIILIEFSPSNAIFLISYNTRIIYSASIIGNIMEIYKSMELSLNRILKVLQDKDYPKEKFGNKKIVNAKGNLDIDNIEFSYKSNNPINSNQKVINGLSMHIKAGEKIAIVGKSGCGKTTLFNVIARLYDTYSGTIKIDGIDTKDLDEQSLRESLSIVQQNTYVFNMSIIENFLIVNSNLSFINIEDICKKVNLHNDILKLENGYDTVIGEGGYILSGGQRQKLSIARCLVKKSPIVLLDEATSALDNISQSKVLETIFKLPNTQTVLLIAHRLSTVINCDKIFFMDEGKIIDAGTHQELLKRCLEYKTLYNEEIKDNS